MQTANGTTTYGYAKTQQTLKDIVRADGSRLTTAFSYDLQGRMELATVESRNTSGTLLRRDRTTYDYDHTGIRGSALNEVDANGDGVYETSTKIEYLSVQIAQSSGVGLTKYPEVIFMPGRREQIEKMIERRPTDSLLRYALAMEYVSEGDHPSAVAQFQRLQQDTPTYVPGYYQHAKTLMQLQRSEEARQILRTGMVIAQHGGDLHALGEMQELLGSIS